MPPLISVLASHQSHHNSGHQSLTFYNHIITAITADRNIYWQWTILKGSGKIFGELHSIYFLFYILRNIYNIFFNSLRTMNDCVLASWDSVFFPLFPSPNYDDPSVINLSKSLRVSKFCRCRLKTIKIIISLNKQKCLHILNKTNFWEASK